MCILFHQLEFHVQIQIAKKCFQAIGKCIFATAPLFYCAVIYSVEQGLLIKMSIFTILIVTYKFGKCIFTTAQLDQKLANDKKIHNLHPITMKLAENDQLTGKIA